MTKPRIGITTSYNDNRQSVDIRYAHAVENAGGIPIFIPMFQQESTVKEFVSLLDGLIMTGGPGITRSDLLVINKIDLAPLVGADLAVMEQDTLRMRRDRPWCFTNLRNGEGLDFVEAFVLQQIPN